MGNFSTLKAPNIDGAKQRNNKIGAAVTLIVLGIFLLSGLATFLEIGGYGWVVTTFGILCFVVGPFLLLGVLVSLDEIKRIDEFMEGFGEQLAEVIENGSPPELVQLLEDKLEDLMALREEMGFKHRFTQFNLPKIYLSSALRGLKRSCSRLSMPNQQYSWSAWPA